MKKLQEIYIPKLFKAYTSIISTPHLPGSPMAGPSVRPKRYFCHSCKTEFTVEHAETRRLGYWGYSDERVNCPTCGAEFRLRSTMFECDEQPNGPLCLTLRLYECKTQIILKAAFNMIRLAHDLKEPVVLETHTEEYRFDIKSRQVHIKSQECNQDPVILQIENPIFARVLLAGSWLRYLKNDTELVKSYKPEIVELLKTLREAVAEKYKELHGYDLSRLFVPSGQTYGWLLMPILNIAYRLQMPEASNLPKAFLQDSRSIYHLHRALPGNMQVMQTPDLSQKWKIACDLAKDKDCITAMLEAYTLPAVKSFRKILQTDSIFAIQELAYCYELSKGDLNHTTTLYKLIRDKFPEQKDTYLDMQRIFEKLMRIKTSGVIPVTKVISILKNTDHKSIQDTLEILSQLNKPNQQVILKCKITEIHDQAANLLYKQKNPNIELSVPDYIKNRLMMQKDKIRFFLPNDSYELKDAGTELHNCVGGYTNKINEGASCVVLVSDDKGKLVACIELHRNKLIQAKLACNKPVFTNARLQAEVLDWCKKCSIAICTSDVKQPEPELSGNRATA